MVVPVGMMVPFRMLVPVGLAIPVRIPLAVITIAFFGVVVAETVMGIIARMVVTVIVALSAG